MHPEKTRKRRPHASPSSSPSAETPGLEFYPSPSFEWPSPPSSFREKRIQAGSDASLVKIQSIMTLTSSLGAARSVPNEWGKTFAGPDPLSKMNKASAYAEALPFCVT